MEGKKNKLDIGIEFLKGVGPKRADMLKKEVGIFSFGDLLLHLPYRYVDKTKFHRIKDITKGSLAAQSGGGKHAGGNRDGPGVIQASGHCDDPKGKVYRGDSRTPVINDFQRIVED